MELQWPLIIFTTLIAWSAGLFATMCILALKKEGFKAQMTAWIVAAVLLVVGGIAVFFHLQHWERIFNGFGHITSGITQELIFIVLMAVAAIIFLVLAVWTLRKRGAIRSGDTALVSMTLLGACQIVLESMRNDGHMVVHFIRIQMVLSLVALLVGLIVFSRRLYKRGGMKKSQQLVLWLVTIVCIGLAIFMEFRVDRGSNKLLYYAVMAACVAAITTMALKCRSKAERTN